MARVRAFCAPVFSPNGDCSGVTLELAKKHYRMGTDMGHMDYFTNQDPYRVWRWYIYRGLTLDAFSEMVE